MWWAEAKQLFEGIFSPCHVIEVQTEKKREVDVRKKKSVTGFILNDGKLKLGRMIPEKRKPGWAKTETVCLMEESTGVITSRDTETRRDVNNLRVKTYLHESDKNKRRE